MKMAPSRSGRAEAGQANFHETNVFQSTTPTRAQVSLERVARYLNRRTRSKFLLSHRYLRKTASHFSARRSRL